jgi:hypothetical protein
VEKKKELRSIRLIPLEAEVGEFLRGSEFNLFQKSYTIPAGPLMKTNWILIPGFYPQSGMVAIAMALHGHLHPKPLVQGERSLIITSYHPDTLAGKPFPTMAHRWVLRGKLPPQHLFKDEQPPDRQFYVPELREWVFYDFENPVFNHEKPKNLRLKEEKRDRANKWQDTKRTKAKVTAAADGWTIVPGKTPKGKKPLKKKEEESSEEPPTGGEQEFDDPMDVDGGGDYDKEKDLSGISGGGGDTHGGSPRTNQTPVA